MEIGQVCIKTRGREAGARVVVLSRAKEGKVLVDGPKAKRRQCNIMHLFPTNDKVKVKEEAPHAEVVKVLGK